MSVVRVLEGTWEEIREHDSELAGQHVRLEVHQNGSRADQGDLDQQEWVQKFKARIGRHSFEPHDLAQRAEEYLADGFGQDSGEISEP